MGPDFTALFGLLDKALSNFQKSRERRARVKKLRRDLNAIEKKRRRERERADAMAEMYRARLEAIAALKDPDERLRQLAKLDRERG